MEDRLQALETAAQQGPLAWVLVAAAMVMFMTPGLALFYGGMDRSRNVLNMLMMNFWCLLAMPVLWAVLGYSLAQAPVEAPFLGGFSKAFLGGIDITDGGTSLMGVAFLGMFAVITPALISGAVAGRMKFSAWAVFSSLWLLLVFVPVFKWVYGGWLGQRGSIDFAGGTAIHVTAGIAALACVLVLGKRKGWPASVTPPHSMPLVMIGTGILWFGWFGFNAGSALGATGQAVQAFMNTFLAAAAGGLGWLAVERIRDGHFTTLGAASGIVAGLVGITPAAGYVTGMSPIAIGAIAGVGCAFAVGLKRRFGYDDALDVVGVHFVGGLIGSLLTGIFANPAFFPEATFSRGLLYGGGLHLFLEQALANGVAIVYGFAVTWLLMQALKRTMGVRVDADTEAQGLDLPQHSETAYHEAAA